MFEALLHREHFENFLFLLQFERQMGGNGVGQAPGIVDSRQRRENFRRDFFVQLDVLVKLLHQRAPQSLRLGIALGIGCHRFGIAGKVGRQIVNLTDIGALHALHKNLHCAIRQLKHLQNVGNTANTIHIVGRRFVFCGRFLRHKHDALAGLHRRLKRLDRLRAADKKRDDHMREHHHITQWQ